MEEGVGVRLVGVVRVWLARVVWLGVVLWEMERVRVAGRLCRCWILWVVLMGVGWQILV